MYEKHKVFYALSVGICKSSYFSCYVHTWVIFEHKVCNNLKKVKIYKAHKMMCVRNRSALVKHKYLSIAKLLIYTP